MEFLATGADSPFADDSAALRAAFKVVRNMSDATRAAGRDMATRSYVAAAHRGLGGMRDRVEIRGQIAGPVRNRCASAQ